QRHHAFAGRALPARGAFEKLHPAQAVARSQRDQQVLLGSEMPVQGADRVLALVGDARHLQVEQPVALDQRLRTIEEPVLAACEFALLAGGGAQERWPGRGRRILNRIHSLIQSHLRGAPGWRPDLGQWCAWPPSHILRGTVITTPGRRPTASARQGLPMRRLPACVPLLLLLAACGGEPAPQTPPPPEVGVIRAEAVDLPLTLEVGGRLSAYRSADVRARVPGVLQQRVYTEGSDVEEGQVLFLIDPAPLQAALGTARAALAQAEANHANARANAERARRLAPQNYVSAADLDNALAAERSAAAAVEAARLTLGSATVRPPCAVRPGRERVTEGALAGQREATLLTTVDQIDPLYANFPLGVGEVDRIRQARAAAPEAVASVDVVLH